MKCTQIKYSLLLLSVVGMMMMMMMASVAGQRAGYAGARPNGLSQKDKYFNTIITGGATNGTVSFDTRFGETPPTVNTLPFGVSQRPPVGAFVVADGGQQAFFGVAQGGAADVATNTLDAGAGFGLGSVVGSGAVAAGQAPVLTQTQPQPQQTSNGIAFGTRVGGTDDNNGVATATANGNTPTILTQTLIQPQGGVAGVGAGVAAQQPQQPLPMPLDAGGDRLLIEQLSRLPQDRQPFWFLNYQAIERQRNGTGSNFAGSIASRGSFMG